MIVTRRSFTDWFDRTYVIHLAERKDRLRSIVAELAKVGVCEEPGRVEIFPSSPHRPMAFPTSALAAASSAIAKRWSRPFKTTCSACS